MRRYSGLDLLRFRRFADENPDLKPIDLVRAYNKKYPELSAKEQYENIVKMLKNMDDVPGEFNDIVNDNFWDLI